MEYFKLNFQTVPMKTLELLPHDNVLRYISLHAHLLQYQTIVANNFFEIHWSTVTQISRNIVSIYSQIYERHFQVVYHWKTENFISCLQEAKQVGF